MNIKCQHMNFKATVKVARLAKSEIDGKITGYMADIKICCVECKREFQFLGLQPGLDLQGSRVSIDGLEAHIAQFVLKVNNQVH